MTGAFALLTLLSTGGFIFLIPLIVNRIYAIYLNKCNLLQFEDAPYVQHLSPTKRTFDKNILDTVHPGGFMLGQVTPLLTKFALCNECDEYVKDQPFEVLLVAESLLQYYKTGSAFFGLNITKPPTKVGAQYFKLHIQFGTQSTCIEIHFRVKFHTNTNLIFYQKNKRPRGPAPQSFKLSTENTDNVSSILFKTKAKFASNLDSFSYSATDDYKEVVTQPLDEHQLYQNHDVEKYFEEQTGTNLFLYSLIDSKKTKLL